MGTRDILTGRAPALGGAHGGTRAPRPSGTRPGRTREGAGQRLLQGPDRTAGTPSSAARTSRPTPLGAQTGRPSLLESPARVPPAGRHSPRATLESAEHRPCRSPWVSCPRLPTGRPPSWSQRVGGRQGRGGHTSLGGTKPGRGPRRRTEGCGRCARAISSPCPPGGPRPVVWGGRGAQAVQGLGVGAAGALRLRRASHDR